MKKLIVCLLCISTILPRCKNQDNQEFRDNSTIDSAKIYFLDFEQNLKNFQSDTFNINSIARNVSFIPLETSSDALLTTARFMVAKLNESYYTWSESTPMTSIIEFDLTGRFKRVLVHRGRGPRELPNIFEWSVNHNTQLLIASSLHEIIVYSCANDTTNKYGLDSFFCKLCLLNDGTIVGTQIEATGDTGTPYLIFRNQEGKIVKSLYYPQKRNISYNIPEGRGKIETYELNPSYTGDALFKDVFNDTIYRIRRMDDVKPYIIVHRGALALTIKDVNNQIASAQKIAIKNVMETNNHFFIKYYYKNRVFCSIWDKQDLSVIANIGVDIDNRTIKERLATSTMVFAKYQTPKEKEILIGISSYFDGKLYGVLSAEEAMEFLPGIKEDDNPVLMIIEL